MPGRDGTGPAGQGPMTGGQRGNCPGVTPKQMPMDGRGMGWGRGGGRGRGWRGGRGMGRAGAGPLGGNIR